MKLKIITSFALFLTILLIGVVLILSYYGIITNVIELITKGVSIISAISIILKGIFYRELKEIDDKWHNLYEQGIKAIEDFERTIPSNANFKEYTKELYNLENTLYNIEKHSNYNFDYAIQQDIKKALGNPQNHSIDNLNGLLNKIEDQTNKLRISRQWWDKW